MYLVYTHAHTFNKVDINNSLQKKIKIIYVSLKRKYTRSIDFLEKKLHSKNKK